MQPWNHMCASGHNDTIRVHHILIFVVTCFMVHIARVLCSYSITTYSRSSYTHDTKPECLELENLNSSTISVFEGQIPDLMSLITCMARWCIIIPLEESRARDLCSDSTSLDFLWKMSLSDSREGTVHVCARNLCLSGNGVSFNRTAFFA